MNRRTPIRLILTSFLIAGCTTGEARNQGQSAASFQSQKELSFNEATAWQETVNLLKREIGKREADLVKVRTEQERLQFALQAAEAETARLATVLTERNSALARIKAEDQLLLARSKSDQLRLQAAEVETSRLITALAERNSDVAQQDLQAAKVEIARLGSALAEREAMLTKTRAEQDKAKAEQDRLQTVLQAAEKDKALLANTLAEREAAFTKAKAEQDHLQAAEKEKTLLVNAAAEHEVALSNARVEQDKAKAEHNHLQAAQVLQAEIAKGNIRVQQSFHQSGEVLLIEIAEPLLFDSALDDRVSVAGIEVLRQTADVLKAMPQKQILIEGHTGNVRIKDKSKAQFSNAVELSKARTLAVLGYLKDFGVDHQNLSASWHLETRPLTLVSKRRDNERKNHYHFDIIASPKDRAELPVVSENSAR